MPRRRRLRHPVATLHFFRKRLAIINDNDEIISHTFIPMTQLSIADKSYSITVASNKSSMVADAWATALNVLGPKEGIRIANDHDIAVLYIMHKDNIVLKSKTWNYSD